MKPLSVIILSSILLSACSISSMIESKYPDRVKFTFSDDYTESDNVYLCEKSTNQEETRKRAQAAHQYLSKEIKRISAEMVGGIMEKEKFSLVSAMGASMDMNKKAKVIGLETEKKYQCLLIDTID